MRRLARTRRVRRTQAFRCSLSELVPLGVLDRGALEELFLFCRRELRKVFAWHLHLDSAGDLDLARVLPDGMRSTSSSPCGMAQVRTDGQVHTCNRKLVRLER